MEKILDTPQPGITFKSTNFHNYTISSGSNLEDAFLSSLYRIEEQYHMQKSEENMLLVHHNFIQNKG